MRPDLRIEPAFLELAKPSFADGRRPAGQGRVRRDRRRPAAADRGLPRQGRRARAVAEATARHESLRIRATRVLGLEPVFLEVLDRRLRDALSDARVRELDALVLAAAGSSDPLANQAVARLARLWGAKHRLPDRRGVRLGRSPGHRRGGPRSSAPRAAATSRSARCSWRPGCLPDRAAELALEAGAVAVSEPLGADPEVARTILARYAVGAVELVPV